MQDYEELEFCKNCNRKTPIRKERATDKIPGSFLTYTTYCKECGQLIRQMIYK